MLEVLTSTEWNSKSSIVIQSVGGGKNSNIWISLTSFLCKASNGTDVELVPIPTHEGVLLVAQQH